MKKGTFIIILFTVLTVVICYFLNVESAFIYTGSSYLYLTLFILSFLVFATNISYYLYKKNIILFVLAIKFALSSSLWMFALINSIRKKTLLTVAVTNRSISELFIISNILILFIILKGNTKNKKQFFITRTNMIFTFILCMFIAGLVYFVDYTWLGKLVLKKGGLIPIQLSIINIMFNIIVMYLFYRNYNKKPSIYICTIFWNFYFVIAAEVCRLMQWYGIERYVVLGNAYDIIACAVPVIGICCEFIQKIGLLNAKIEEERICENKLMKYYSIIESIDILIAIVDENNVPEYLNPSFKKLLDFYHKKDYSELKFKFKGVSSYEEIFEKAAKNKVIMLKAEINDVNGRRFYDMSVYHIKDESTDANSFVMLLSDETDTNLLTKHLVNNERKFRNITNNISDFICQLDVNGKILYCSPSYTRVFGGLYQDYIGISVLHNVCKEYVKQVMDDIKKCLEQKDIISNQCMMIVDTLSDKKMWVNYVVSPLNGKEINSGVIISGRDITKIKQAEEQRLKEAKKLKDTLAYDKIKTEFFSNISHELRTPINVIFSILQVIELQNNSTEDYYKKYNKALKQNCYRLLRLINNLIDITKIDSGFLKLTVGKYDIISLIEDMTQSVVPYAEAKGLTLIFDTYEEEQMVYCDPDKIERIILNLLSNAIKFTPKGGKILVTISVDKENNNVVISIKDNGVGIPQDMLDVVFERFRQVDKSLTRQNEGSGIGLSLVKSLVELHKGTIKLKSKVGQGSEFIINIPIDANKDQYKEISVIQHRKSNIETINVEFSDIYEV